MKNFAPKERWHNSGKNKVVSRDHAKQLGRIFMQASAQLLDQSDSKKRTSITEQSVSQGHEYLDIAKDIGSKAISRGSAIVKSNPGYSILGAAAVGFLAGAYLARKK